MNSTFCNSAVIAMKGTLLVRVLGMLRIESILEQVYTKGSWSWDPISLHWTMAFDKCCVECLASGPDVVLARHEVGASRGRGRSTCWALRREVPIGRGGNDS